MKKELTFNVSELNNGQKEVFNALKEFVAKNDGSMAVVKGFAGTGKTYTIKKFIDYIHLKYPSYKIVVTGPTNKAVFVLSKYKNIKDLRVKYQTIHKLLGLKEVIHNDGKITFEPEFNSKNEILQYKILILDEVSMLDDTIFKQIEIYRDRVKIIFMGDPLQIPPVNNPDCIPFNDRAKKFYPFNEFTLTEIMRQSLDNPIIEASFNIRNNITEKDPTTGIKTTLNEKGNGIIRINPTLLEDRDTTLKMFEKYFKCDEFRKDADHAKVLAWRNVTIAKVNKIIRNILYGENPPKLMPGEKLIANKPIIGDLDIIIFNTSDEFEVSEFNIATEIYVSQFGQTRFKYYDTIVSFYDLEGKENERNIKILHEDSQHDFDAMAKALREVAITTKGANMAWKKYYAFIRMFADVTYSLSISCHKAQGSTYKNVFVLEDDINKNYNTIEKNRILYTSYSRASEKLFVIKQ